MHQAACPYAYSYDGHSCCLERVICPAAGGVCGGDVSGRDYGEAHLKQLLFADTLTLGYTLKGDSLLAELVRRDIRAFS